MITVIYCIRDRDPKRLSNSIKSLKKVSSEKASFVVVDYGSSIEYAERIARICKEEDAKYVRTETQGLPWSRGNALNIGVVNSDTEFVATTDIDMIFESDILKISLEKYKPNTVIHCQSLLLPRSGLKTFGKWGDKSQLGGYMFLKKGDFLKVGGFDEEIKYWGHEDFEIENKLHNGGVETIWLENCSMFHVWHPKSNTFLSDRPESSWYDTLKISLKNVIYTKKTEKVIGESICKRPILSSISNSQPKIFKIKNYEKDIPNLIELSKKEKFIRLEFPKRMTRRFFLSSILDGFFLFLNSTILSICGYKISVQKNSNFDLFYMSLPLLKEIGLEDYYLYDNYEMADILFRKN